MHQLIVSAGRVGETRSWQNRPPRSSLSSSGRATGRTLRVCFGRSRRRAFLPSRRATCSRRTARRRRAGYFHFKDGNRGADGKPVFLELGRGYVDLKGSMQAAREVGAEWIVAEQDRTELPHLESVRISRDYLRRELGV